MYSLRSIQYCFFRMHRVGTLYLLVKRVPSYRYCIARIDILFKIRKQNRQRRIAVSLTIFVFFFFFFLHSPYVLLIQFYYLAKKWVDYNLQWKTEDYGGVKDLRISPKTIWKPDILMYNR